MNREAAVQRTAKRFQELYAVHKIQRAVRAYLPKKYITNANGTLPRNIITAGPIPKSLAIQIATPTGLLRWWDASGLYDWFIKLNNTELQGFISELPPHARREIQNRVALYNKLAKQKILLRQQKLAAAHNVLVQSRKNRDMFRADALMSVLGVLIGTMTMIFITLSLFHGNPALIPFLIFGALGGIPDLRSHRIKAIETYTRQRLLQLEKRLNQTYNQIELRNVNVRFIKYILFERDTPFSRRTVRKLNAVAQKMSNLGVIFNT